MSVTLVIIVITVLTSMYAWSNQGIFYKWMLNPYAINRKNEYFRFITSGFIHNDYMHLLFNMFTLYFFGDTIEQTYNSLFGESGTYIYVGFYLIGIVVSSLPTYIKHRNHPHYNSLGASGGVSAVIFSAILFYPVSQLCLYGFLCLPGFIFGALYMVYSYYQSRRGGDFINHDAHLFGALFGIVFTIIIVPAVVPRFFEQVASWRLFG
jgi:membrane associated rhomboid family serine protease